MGKFYNEYLRDMSFKEVSEKVDRMYENGGEIKTREDSLELNRLADAYNTYITNNSSMYNDEALFETYDQIREAKKLLTAYNEKAPKSFQLDDNYFDEVDGEIIKKEAIKGELQRAPRFDMSKKPSKKKKEKLLKIDPIQTQLLPVDLSMKPIEAGIPIEKDKYTYSKYWKPNERQYRVTVRDKSKRGKSQNIQITDDVPLDMFKQMWKGEYGGDPQDTLRINKMPTDQPTFTPIDPDSGEVIVKPPKKPVQLLVNKHGWADVDEYRKKSNDSEFIKETQDLVITDGFDIDNDGVWGNKTYNAINQDLVNKQLNNYTNSYFTDEQFEAQIYKESTGDNTKISEKGAMGIAQFLPSTFKWAKEKGWIPETAKITDQAAQALAQRRYMDHIYKGDATNSKSISSATTPEERQARTFAAYNMGPTKFDKFWAKLSKAEKEAGWETWYKKANDESKMYVLWNMDRATYKKDYSTPYKHKRGYMTSKWNDVNYGFNTYKNKKVKYRY
tara:strand:+ start:16737 stop:18242 length:1506 start_codon:yes stop_codon:yes gene_type:complete